MDGDYARSGDRVRPWVGAGLMPNLDHHGPREGEDVYAMLLYGWELYAHMLLTKGVKDEKPKGHVH